MYLLAGLIGGLVGVAELVSRYKDSPAKAVRLLPAWIYVAINAGDVDRLGTDILKLQSDTTLDDKVKALNLGLVLTRYVGEDVLRKAVESLGELIKG